MRYFLIALCLIALFGCGYLAGNSQTETIEKVVYIEGQTKYVDRIEYVPETIIETEYYTTLKDFDNYNDFTEWLALQIAHNDPDYNWSWGCEDYAKWLCQRAADDGYFVGYMSINSSEYETMFGRVAEGRHAINVVWVGELRYWIDSTNGNKLYGGY